MNKHMKKAIELLDGQVNLAKVLGVQQSYISHMLTERQPVSSKMAMKIEALTDGQIKAVDLCPVALNL